jgi:hypothetical protein
MDSVEDAGPAARNIFIQKKTLCIAGQGKAPQVPFSANESGSGSEPSHQRSSNSVDSLAWQLSSGLFLHEYKWVLIPSTLQVFRQLLLP